MTGQDRLALRGRITEAILHGWGFAKAEEIAAELVADGATMPEGVKVPSAAQLLVMLEEAGQPRKVELNPKPRTAIPPPPPSPAKVEEVKVPEANSEEKTADDLTEMLNAFGDS